MDQSSHALPDASGSSIASSIKTCAEATSFHDRYRLDDSVAEAEMNCSAARGPHPPAAPQHHHDPEGHRHTPLKPAVLLDQTALLTELQRPCCAHKCLKSWTVSDALQFRSEMAKRNELERLEFLLQDILPNCVERTSGRHLYRLQHAHDGKPVEFVVCRCALLVILGVSAGKLGHALHLRQLKVHTVVHGNTARRESAFALMCESWLAAYVTEFCDKVSDKVFELPGELQVRGG